MKNNKGFSKIEVTSIIIVLAIVGAVFFYGITKLINNAKHLAFESNIKLVITTLEYYQLKDIDLDITTINEKNLDNIIKLSSEHYKSLTVTKVNGVINVVAVGKGNWNGLTACGDKQKIKVVNNDDCKKNK